MSECRYRPLFGRVIIKREVVKQTLGGIIMPEQFQKKHTKCEGIVVAIGETVEGISVGDKVIFGRHAGTWLDATYSDKGEQDDGSLFLCQDEDILAVIND